MRLTNILSPTLLTTMIALSTACSAATVLPIAATGEGRLGTVAATGHIIATYLGSTAGFSNDLYLSQPGGDVFIFNNKTSPVGAMIDLGHFTAGEELIFRLFVRDWGQGHNYFSGPAERSRSGRTHARMQSEWKPGETLVSFEDQPNGAFHYNDLSFSFTNVVDTVPPPSSVPVPASVLLLVSALGALGAIAALRRRVR